MKNIYYILISTFLLFSCNEYELEEVCVEDASTTKSLHPREFETNWEKQKDIILTNGQKVELPWVLSASTDIPNEIREDIKKENGWIFMSTPNQDRGADYLIFYNKFTGILKVFYYHSTATLNNNAIWVFHDQGKKGYFNQGSYFTIPVNKEAISNTGVSPLSKSSTLGISLGWNCFQIPITYTGKSGSIDVSPMVLNISSLELTGNYDSKTEGTIVEQHSSNPANNMFNSIAKASGNGANKWITDKGNNSNSGIFKYLSPSMLGNLASGGVSGLVSTGLKSLFGSFIGVLKKDTPTVQTVELTTTGEFKANGSIQSPSTAIALPLNGIDATNLGVWNLAETPKIKASVQHVLLEYYKPKESNPLSEYYEVSFFPEYKVVINPTILEEVEYTTSYQFIMFQGSKWDTFFIQYYKLALNNYIRFRTNLDPGMEFPTLYQGNSKSETSNKVILTKPDLLVGTGRYNMDPMYHKNPDEFNKAIYPYVYTYPYHYNKRRTSLSTYPQKDLSNGTINGKPGLYPGNVGLNITVTMTVKKTGEKIVSSRTFLPDYVFAFK